MKLILTGDALFSSSNLAETMDPQLLCQLRDADAVVTNAEFVTPKPNTPPAAGRGYQTSLKPKALQEFSNLNIKYVSFANNHTGDYGVEGLKDTLEEAQNQNLVPLGVGQSLAEARKPVFIDHKEARVAIVTVAITRSEVFAASDPGNGVPARPGVNPLRSERRYVVTPEDFESLKQIDKRIGTAESMQEGKRIETFQEQEGMLDFGSLFEGYITFERGEQPMAKAIVNAEDEEQILRAINDAKYRSDYVILNYHTHEGSNENWYSDYAADFVKDFSYKAVDAGANLIVGHGAHFTRGIERYKNSTIFYNIGSLFMEFEAGESIISPEMFAAYGYSATEMPSTLHRNRAKDKQGQWTGFYSDKKFSENFLVQLELKSEQTQERIRLIPIDLQMQHDRVAKRGLPVLGDSNIGKSLADRLNRISTNVTVAYSQGYIDLF